MNSRRATEREDKNQELARLAREKGATFFNNALSGLFCCGLPSSDVQKKGRKMGGGRERRCMSTYNVKGRKKGQWASFFSSEVPIEQVAPSCQDLASMRQSNENGCAYVIYFLC